VSNILLYSLIELFNVKWSKYCSLDIKQHSIKLFSKILKYCWKWRQTQIKSNQIKTMASKILFYLSWLPWQWWLFLKCKTLNAHIHILRIITIGLKNILNQSSFCKTGSCQQLLSETIDPMILGFCMMIDLWIYLCIYVLYFALALLWVYFEGPK
jgi:hypothetical protein